MFQGRTSSDTDVSDGGGLPQEVETLAEHGMVRERGSRGVEGEKCTVGVDEARANVSTVLMRVPLFLILPEP